MDASPGLPLSVLAVVNDLIDRYRQTDHESALAAVSWKREVAVPAIRRVVATAGDAEELADWSRGDLEMEAVGQFNRTLGFRTYEVRARASVKKPRVTFASDETD